MSSFLISGRPATNHKAFVPVVTEQAFPVLASSITRSFRVGGIVPPEIRNNMLGRFSAMGAADDRDGVYSPEVIKELAAFRILALKHPQAVFNVVHSDSLKNVPTNCSSPATETPTPRPSRPLVRSQYFSEEISNN
jgi:hypothetical protein